MTAGIWILALVTAQRLFELVIAKAHTRRLMAKGAWEAGAEHYPWMIALHSSWLMALWVLAWNRPVELFPFALFLIMQVLRIWVLATLGERWTTRIIILPDAPLVAKGPFRWVRHPNYWVVVLEIALLPLAFGLPWLALIYSLLNALMLWVRIGCENRALGITTQPEADRAGD